MRIVSSYLILISEAWVQRFAPHRQLPLWRSQFQPTHNELGPRHNLQIFLLHRWLLSLLSHCLTPLQLTIAAFTTRVKHFGHRLHWTQSQDSTQGAAALVMTSTLEALDQELLKQILKYLFTRWILWVLFVSRCHASAKYFAHWAAGPGPPCTLSRLTTAHC